MCGTFCNSTLRRICAGWLLCTMGGCETSLVCRGTLLPSHGSPQKLPNMNFFREYPYKGVGGRFQSFRLRYIADGMSIRMCVGWVGLGGPGTVQGLGSRTLSSTSLVLDQTLQCPALFNLLLVNACRELAPCWKNRVVPRGRFLMFCKYS